MNLDYSQDFPYKERIYLNNASTSRMPRSSIAAMSDFLVKYNELGPDSEASDNYVKERLGNLRKEISGLIKCRPEEIVLTQSVTDGINFVANGLKLNPNSNIVTRGSTHEHPANHYPWVRVGQRVELRSLPINETGYFEPDTFTSTIDKNTGLVVLSHALFNTGAIIPVEEIGKILSEKNIPYFVDTAQTIGCISDVDVNKINCNFMSFNGSKWLCGPMGMGIFFCRRDSSDLIEPLQVGGESAIFHEDKISHKEMPARFQAGFRNWSGVAGLEASVIYLKKIGISTIREKNIKLANLLRQEISKIDGAILYGPEEEERRTSIVSFSVKDKDSKTLVARLEKNNIILAVRDIFSKKIVRASPHFYNTESEIHAVIDLVKKG
ncbi:aminotransferase class V-fold PLP-dependent enzyme [Candidatus Nitrosotalea okcheonensis]|uniref:Class V aminotransferase n=1 Tax=Candidatus Nitrosotalea okcheonensis TaxID=1903276 RepID=A0A2H1FH35_9ARCH|nr:aminotransferase class V-fold PLP-dependent enzyme [Candidatus Nitrosotalea okcheonensis]SMH72054.1 Class V aminotransferase [Candidatus Nitrosotalea okcheonensis]